MIRIGVTLGDPAGIGPEVVSAAAAEVLGRGLDASLVLYGPAGIADAMADALGPRVRAVVLGAFEGTVGHASAAGGRSALQALQAAIHAAKGGDIDALATAPISKEALALAGSQDRGHTEILARHLGNGPVAMAFFAPTLRVVLATAHIPLCEVFDQLTSERVREVAQLLRRALQAELGGREPRLALAGLNPHAGEAGLLGNEEKTILEPAVMALQDEGCHISGPWPPDTVFRRALDGDCDGVVALYHDQGLIPVKLLAFGEAVNVTLGLRVPRTSPDHGTAFDIAGRGLARPGGMRQALLAAQGLAQPKKKNPNR